LSFGEEASDQEGERFKELNETFAQVIQQRPFYLSKGSVLSMQSEL